MLSEVYRQFKACHILLQSKYSDSKLGILWVPISSLFLVGVLVAIFGVGHSDELLDYAAYISVGYICWGLIADTLNNHGDIFRSKKSILTSPGVTLNFVLVNSLIERVYLAAVNFLGMAFLFAGNVIDAPSHLLFFPVAVVIVLTQAYATSILLSLGTLFFPDLKRLISNVTRVLFFASPIFWGFGGSLGGAREYFIHYNPVSYFLDIFRFSLGGESVIGYERAFTISALIAVGTFLAAYLALRTLPNYFRNIQ